MGEAKRRKEFLRDSGMGFVELFDNIGNVPCNGCISCCYHGKVDISKFDDPSQYDTEIRDDGSICLKRNPDGSCIYLGSSGCTIHDRRPHACRGYDCRLYAAAEMRVGYAPGRVTPAWIIHEKTWADLIAKEALRFNKIQFLSENPDVGADDVLRYAVEKLEETGDKLHGFLKKLADVPADVLTSLKRLPSSHKIPFFGDTQIEAGNLLKFIEKLRKLANRSMVNANECSK